MSVPLVSETERRRSANYKPSNWSHQYIRSLNSVYGEDRFLQRAKILKAQVVDMLERTIDTFEQIQVVDVLQRLGIPYQFTDYIKKVLDNISNSHGGSGDRNLHATALSFRLLRQHGHNVSMEVFKNFMDENGNFKSSLYKDTRGLLCLYEASYLSFEGETILDEAKEFAARHLKQKLKQKSLSEDLADEVAHALETPFHHAMQRLESRWFIEAYGKREDMNPIMLELAKLDFNMVQAMYQDELKELSRWHTRTCLTEKMTFARDRLVESFLWTVGITYEPRFRYCRIMSAKIAMLITIIDDLYDVYGTLDELELFTDAVKRWDIHAIEQLPKYTKICFLALFNMMNESAYDVLRDQGFNIIPQSASRWAELCKSFLLEAKWYHDGHKPSLNEYLSNGLVSISGTLVMEHVYFYMMNQLKEKPIEGLKIHPEVVKWMSMVCRLVNDLGTSSDEIERGDSPNSIQCYMHDTGCSEEEARGHIKALIVSAWKKINEDTLKNHEHSRDLISASINFARTFVFIYQYGDRHGTPDRELKSRILSLLMKPIPLP